MASYQKMGQELECPICMDFFKVPKLMGKCHHAACLECLQNLIAVAVDKVSFPCPVCREKCSVPPEGLTDLKTDHRLATLTEKYQQMMSDKSVVYNCNACSNRAFHLCETCDKIYLCRECSRKHGQDPLTAAHKLVGICSKHGKILTLYCRKCCTAICSVCLINDHPSDSQEHDVVPHERVADDEQAEAVAAVAERLDGTQKRKENALGNVIDSVLATIDCTAAKFTQQLDRSIELPCIKHAELHEKSSKLQKYIEKFTKLKNTVDEEIVSNKQMTTSLHQQKERHTQYLNQYRDGCRDKFHAALTEAVTENEINRLGAKFLAAKEDMIRLVPASGQVVPQLRFSTMKKFAAEFCAAESERYKLIQRIKHLPDGRLAVLHTDFRSRRSDHWSDRISLHGSELEECRVRRMEENIHPAVDMTVSLKGELFVLRRAIPAVRVFNTHNSDFCDINIVGTQAIRNVFSIEIDEEGNIFVAHTDGTLHVFNSEGAIINEIRFSTAYLGRLNYCRYTRHLHIADGQKIMKYHWDGTSLNGMSSLALGSDGFSCMDIGIGTGGEVFVAGVMKPTGKVLVFQIVGPECKMIKLTFEDNVDRYLPNGHEDWFPDISVFGNTLALGLKGKLELFHLKP